MTPFLISRLILLLIQTVQVSVKYQQNEKHFNYTTPKSFLEFMKLYGNLLGKKRTELSQKMERLENGLQKLLSTASQVRPVHVISVLRRTNFSVSSQLVCFFLR